MKIDKKLDNVIFLNKIVKNAVPALLEMFDSTLITCNKTTLYRFGVSPNKFFDYMMAQKPIVQALDAGNNMVNESGCGISVPPEEPIELAQAMLNIR